MGVSQSPPDPWLPLDRAHGDLPSTLTGTNDGPIAALVRWATAAMWAFSTLRVDVRELFSRTAKLNDRVSAVEGAGIDLGGAIDRVSGRLNAELGNLFRDEVKRLDSQDVALSEAAKAHVRLTEDHASRLEQVEEVVADTAQGAADGEALLHREVKSAREAAKTWIVSLGRRVDHAFARIDFHGRMISQLTEAGFMQQWRLEDLEGKQARLQLLVDEILAEEPEDEEPGCGVGKELDDAIAYLEAWLDDSNPSCECDRCEAIRLVVAAARRSAC